MMIIIFCRAYLITWNDKTDGMKVGKVFGMDSSMDSSMIVWMVTVQRRQTMGTYLVRFFRAEFDIGGMDISITYSPHSHRRLRKWLVRFVCMDLVLREMRMIRLLCYLHLFSGVGSSAG